MSSTTSSKATTAASNLKEKQDQQQQQQKLTPEQIAKWHGYLCINEPWAQTHTRTCIYKNDALARKDYTDITRSEYRDSDQVLSIKADILINKMFKKAQHASIFVGAGIEVSCGTPDYASHDRSKPQEKLPTTELSPSPAHRVIAGMFNRAPEFGFKFASGRCFVQQNHSCMFERAGVDFNRVNNMHGVNLRNTEKVPGALGREVNPVVKMSGSLRDDLFDDILKLEEEADFCFALGSSFSGMNVERVATSCAKRHIKSGGKDGQGLAMITLQCTPVDNQCALRVFDYCDHFMMIVAQKLNLLIDVNTDYQWNTGKPRVPRRPLTKAAKEAEEIVKVMKAKMNGGNNDDDKSEETTTIKKPSTTTTTRRTSSTTKKSSTSNSRSTSVGKTTTTTTRATSSKKDSSTTTAAAAASSSQRMRFKFTNQE